MIGASSAAFQTELEILNKLGKELGLVKLDDNLWCRHPLAYLLEAADDICYAILDLEDAIELNILSFDQIKPILLEMCGVLEVDDEIFNTEASARRKISALRGRAMENMINSAVSAFMEHYPKIMAGEYKGELVSDGDPGVRDGIQRAKTLARDRVFPDTRKTELEVGAYRTLGALLDAFCRAVYDNHQQQGQNLSYQTEKILSLMGIHAPSKDKPLYHSYMRALDFIGGMTDNYASYLARQIGGLV